MIIGSSKTKSKTHPSATTYIPIHRLHVGERHFTCQPIIQKAIVVGKFIAAPQEIWVNIHNCLQTDPFSIPTTNGQSFGLRLTLEETNKLIADLEYFRDLQV